MAPKSDNQNNGGHKVNWHSSAFEGTGYQCKNLLNLSRGEKRTGFQIKQKMARTPGLEKMRARRGHPWSILRRIANSSRFPGKTTKL